MIPGLPSQNPAAHLFVVDQIGAVSFSVLVALVLARAIRSGVARQFAIGLVFGLGSCIAMLHAHEPVPAGQWVDMRLLFVGLSAGLAGLVAGAVCTVVAGLYIIAAAGSETVLELIMLAVTLLLATIWRHASRYEIAEERFPLWRMIGLGVVVALPPVVTVGLKGALTVSVWDLLLLTVAGDIFGAVGTGYLVLTSLRTARGEAINLQLAQTDPLTGLLNRRGLRTRYAELVAATPGDILFITADVNRLKELNDRLGHDVGDLVLQRTALHLSNLVQNRGLVARLGGDEFLVIMPAKTPQEAARFIGFARKATNYVMRLPGSGCPLRVETAVGSHFAASGDGLDEPLRASDLEMYRVKRQGRSSVAPVAVAPPIAANQENGPPACAAGPRKVAST